MNRYETVFILNPTITDEELEAIIEKITTIITADNGKIEKIDKMGIRKLAYDIKKNNEGFYVVITFTTETEKITELERYYRIKDDIIKFLTIRKDED